MNDVEIKKEDEKRYLQKMLDVATEFGAEKTKEVSDELYKALKFQNEINNLGKSDTSMKIIHQNNTSIQ